MARNECPPYQGFAWDHPLMVHWRKTHAVNPGLWRMLRLELAPFAGLIYVAGFCLIGTGLVHTDVWSALIGGAMVSFCLGWWLCRLRQEARLKAWSGAAELDKLLEQLEKLMEFHPGAINAYLFLRNTPWMDLQKRARGILIDYAREVLRAEMIYRSDPLRAIWSDKKQVLVGAFSIFEEAGLVEGGYGPFFDEAKQLLAKEEQLPSKPPSDRYQGGPTL